MAKRGRPIIFSEAENIVAQLRRKLGTSQRALGDMIGANDVSVSLFEQGKAKPSKSTMILCKILLKYPDILKTLD